MAIYDILGLGVATVDELLYVAAFPAPDTKMQIQRSERRMGGLTAVALAAAARLGAHPAYAGMLGDDDISRFVEATLGAEGVDTSQVVRRGDAQPVHAVIIVDTSVSSRTILYEMKGQVGADDHLPTEVHIRAARVLLIDDYNAPGSLRAAQIARAAGIPVVADFERNDSRLFGDVLALVDHLILSAGFAYKITGAVNPAEALRQLWSDKRAAVVITGGDQGCWYMTAGQGGLQHQPAFPVQAVDTTGCGDVFHGVYAAALAWGLDMSARIQLASAAAALKATGPGIQNLPDRAGVEAFLGQFKR